MDRINELGEDQVLSFTFRRLNTGDDPFSGVGVIERKEGFFLSSALTSGPNVHTRIVDSEDLDKFGNPPLKWQFGDVINKEGKSVDEILKELAK